MSSFTSIKEHFHDLELCELYFISVKVPKVRAKNDFVKFELRNYGPYKLTSIILAFRRQCVAGV